MQPILLASGSPRRRELLTQAGIPFTVVPSSAEELRPEEEAHMHPEEVVLENARRKALAVSGSRPGEIVLGADTVVHFRGRIMGKPVSRDDAKEMLTVLSGQTHQVVTGICITDGKKTLSESVRTDVVFRALSPEQIDRYLDTGEYADKAGAYGIQGRGCILVEKLTGDYFNVVGLPVCRVYEMLERFTEGSR